VTLPWSKLPRSLAGDPRLTLLSPEAACAYLYARLLADDYGSLWCVGDRDAAGTLAAVIATKRAGDPGWARQAVNECVAAGLIDLCDDGATLRVVDWLADGAPVQPVDDRPAQAARGRGRPPKGSAPMSQRERRVRSAFKNREWVEFRGVPEGVTWEQWAAEHPALRTKLLRDANENTERNSPVRTKVANENTLSGRAVSETSESSETKKDGETREKRESPDARECERKSRTKIASGANETPAARTKIPAATCTTIEAAAPFAADEVLSRMSAASGQRIAAASTTVHMQTFGAVARDLIANGHASVDGLVKAAGHAAHVAWIQKRREPLTVERLTFEGGKLLVELLTGASTCRACGGAPLASDAPHPDDDAVEAARRRYRTAPVAPAAHGDAR